MEAICRLNPAIGDLDFGDRMAPVIQKKWKTESVQMEDGTMRKFKVLQKKDGPAQQTKSEHASRARPSGMRIPTWPEPKETAYHQKIDDELGQWGCPE